MFFFLKISIIWTWAERKKIKVISRGLTWKMKPWAYFLISIAWPLEGNYFFPLWNRGNIACHRSHLTVFPSIKNRLLRQQIEIWTATSTEQTANQNTKIAWQYCANEQPHRFHCNWLHPKRTSISNSPWAAKFAGFSLVLFPNKYFFNLHLLTLLLPFLSD